MVGSLQRSSEGGGTGILGSIMQVTMVGGCVGLWLTQSHIRYNADIEVASQISIETNGSDALALKALIP